MTWPIPEYTRNQVNRAGDILSIEGPGSREYDWAVNVLTNWRSCHNYPINTFQATLRSRLKGVDEVAIVAQRLKRTPSIVSKLQRFDKMRLARMQDIGGLRAVVATLSKARPFVPERRSPRCVCPLDKRSRFALLWLQPNYTSSEGGKPFGTVRFGWDKPIRRPRQKRKLGPGGNLL